MNPGEDKKPKTTREKKCPECGSEKIIYRSGGAVAATKRPPDPSHRLFECQQCGKHFWYVGS